MRLYPTLPHRRNATIAGDAAVVLLVALFAWLGFVVHDAIAELASLGRGVQDAGTAVQTAGRDADAAVRDGFGSAADAVGGAPVVGGTLSEALRDAGAGVGGVASGAGDDSGGSVAAAGRRGEEATLDAARLLGWLTFGIPVLLLLSRTLPPRVRQVQSMSAAERVLGAGDLADPGRRALLARRAALSLPYGALLRHTPDPLGDLQAGRHDALLAALGEDAGLALSPRASASATVPPAAR